MNKTKTFSPEVQERAVRRMEEHRQDYPSQWSANQSPERFLQDWLASQSQKKLVA